MFTDSTAKFTALCAAAGEASEALATKLNVRTGRDSEQFCLCPKSRPGGALTHKRARSASSREAATKKQRTCGESSRAQSGPCQECSATKTSRWYKGGTQCQACNRKEKASQGGPCKKCSVTKTSRWHKGGTQCQACYQKEKASQGGPCKECSATKTSQWLKGGTQCHACYQKGRASQGGPATCNTQAWDAVQRVVW